LIFGQTTVIIFGFCVITQNFAKIVQFVVELWPKATFPNMASSATLNLSFEFWSNDFR